MEGSIDWVNVGEGGGEVLDAHFEGCLLSSGLEFEFVLFGYVNLSSAFISCFWQREAEKR